MCITPTRPLIHYSEGIRLAGQSAQLYTGMLRLFAEDPSIARLERAVLDGDLQEAFLQAHTLKGLSSQLALIALYDESSLLCDLLRVADTSALPSARARLPGLRSVYRETLLEISRYISSQHP